MKLAAALLASALLAGCATAPGSGCPAGQPRLRTAELYFSRDAAGRQGISDAAFRKFVADEITPRFPQGLTVLDGGPQWQGKENQRLHDASKVVLIPVPGDRDPSGLIEAVRGAYKTRFSLDSAVKISDPNCAAL